MSSSPVSSPAPPEPAPDYYRALFDEAYDALLLFDEAGVLVDCNQTALRLLHTTRPELLAAGLMAFAAPPTSTQDDTWLSEEMLRAAITQTARTGAPCAQWWYGRPTDFTPPKAWVMLHRMQLPGGIIRVQLTLRNAPPQQYPQEALTLELATGRTSHQLRDLLSRAGLCYVLADPEATILDVNTYFLESTGYTRAEVIGRKYYDMFYTADRQAVHYQAFMNSIQEERMHDFRERTMVTKAGELRTLYWHTEFSRDTNGQISGVFCIGCDLTERRQADQALTTNRTQLQDFLDNAHDLILNLDVDNHFLFVNKAWKEKLGYSEADLELMKLDDVVHPYYKAKLRYQLQSLRQGEQANKLETVFITKTGKPVHLIGSIDCAWQDGKPVSTRAILHDITDRIKAERLQKVYYSIANLAISANDLQSLYGAIHRELSKIIETSNFYIALCDEGHTQLQFAYYVDQNIPNQGISTSRPFSSGVSEYIIRTGEPLIMSRAQLQELILNGTITAYGLVPEVMLCSPLSVGERIIGMIAVQDYEHATVYSPADLEVLHFISNQVALAIERKRNEVQINKQNARLNAIFESGSHLMWSVDTQQRLTSFNRNYAAYFLRRNGVYPTLNINLWHADVAMMDKEARTAFIENYQQAFAGHAQRFEVRVRDARGQDTWREIYLNPIYLSDGSFEEISGIAHDITEQKRSQLGLAAQEEKFRAIFESFQDIYYRTDDQGLVTIASPSVKQVLGYEPEEVIGHPILEFHCNPEDRERVKAEVRLHGALRNFETQMRHKDGHPVSVLVSARRVQGAEIGTEGIARDISEMQQMQNDLRRAKDEAETALHAKTQFLANMSHELRTPMNGIIGMIDLLHQTVASEEQEEYVDTLRKSSDALLAILNDILDLSKIQAGKMELHETGVDLHYTLEKIYSLFSNRAIQKNLRFTYYITAHTPRYVVTDETRLLQILSNLTANAIKFTAQGTVSIVVSSVSTDGREHTLRFAVQDSGIGISAENEKLLFTNFTQLDTTPTKAFGGTGLGLAISKQLSELLGGEIGVISHMGDGSSFWFTIRCQVADNEAEISQARLASRERPPEMVRFEVPPRVLLVDDNAINQKVAQRLLDKLGCQVDVACDGFEAIGKATAPHGRYDVIFMDIQMPEMDGVMATAEIRHRLGAACPPVVAMTAYSMKEDAERFLQQGLDDYLPKPVKSADLYSVLRRWTTVRRPQDPGSAPIPAPADAPTLAVGIEPGVLEQLRQLGGVEFAAQLYAEFDQEAGELLREASEYVAQGQYEQILPHLHQIKGTGFTLGLTALATCAKDLEHDLKNGKLHNIAHDFHTLRHFFTQFQASYPALTHAV